MTTVTTVTTMECEIEAAVEGDASLATLRREYVRALCDEVRYIDSMPPRASREQQDVVQAKIEATTRALRAYQSHPEYNRG